MPGKVTQQIESREGRHRIPFAQSTSVLSRGLAFLAMVGGLYLLTMLSARLNPRAHPSLWAALGFFCCALIICAGIVQVGHTHLGGQAIQDNCALCHTAHVVVEPITPQSLPHTVYVVAAIPAPRRLIRPKHFSVFSLFTRPPPVDIAFA